MLVLHGAHLDAQDYSGWTPLHVACYCLYNAGITLLAKKGADVNAKTTLSETPLNITRKYNELTDGCAELLLKLDADPTITDKSGWTPQDYEDQLDKVCCIL